jgi:hypothetical protein
MRSHGRDRGKVCSDHSQRRVKATVGREGREEGKEMSVEEMKPMRRRETGGDLSEIQFPFMCCGHDLEDVFCMNALIIQ